MSRTALIVTDMLNTYDHPDADALTRSVEDVAPVIARIVDDAPERDTLVVYVNDNYGSWTSDRDDLIDRALDGRRRDLVEPIVPSADAMLVIKARHSIFYQTPLEYLLRQEEVGRVVITGQVTEQCILYSALDAYIRHFEVAVPRNAVACIHEDLAAAALEMMERNMSADVSPAPGPG